MLPLHCSTDRTCSRALRLHCFRATSTLSVSHDNGHEEELPYRSRSTLDLPVTIFTHLTPEGKGLCSILVFQFTSCCSTQFLSTAFLPRGVVGFRDRPADRERGSWSCYRHNWLHSTRDKEHATLFECDGRLEKRCFATILIIDIR